MAHDDSKLSNSIFQLIGASHISTTPFINYHATYRTMDMASSIKETLKPTLNLKFQLPKKVLNIFKWNKNLDPMFKKTWTRGIEKDIQATLKI